MLSKKVFATTCFLFSCTASNYWNGLLKRPSSVFIFWPLLLKVNFSIVLTIVTKKIIFRALEERRKKASFAWQYDIFQIVKLLLGVSLILWPCFNALHNHVAPGIQRVTVQLIFSTEKMSVFRTTQVSKGNSQEIGKNSNYCGAPGTFQTSQLCRTWKPQH